MARKVESFKVDAKKKTITIYTNVKESAAEKELKEWYLSQGYAPMMGEKKPSPAVAQMKKELKAAPEVLAEFERVYNEKPLNKKDRDRGFFGACKIYTQWKKSNKTK